MESLLVSTGVVALAEIGDKTQLLAFLLAARFKKPLPIIAGILVATTGRGWWDTVVALAIGVFVAVRAVVLGREVLAVLGQHVPEGVHLDDVVRDLEAVAGVADVHDLHVWTLTSGMYVATAHLVVEDSAAGQAVLESARGLMRTEHHIEHATLQVESRATKDCHEATW